MPSSSFPISFVISKGVARHMVHQFANHGRLGGGYCAGDMALHDLAGKLYGVLAWLSR
jgi:hypothetical protein